MTSQKSKITQPKQYSQEKMDYFILLALFCSLNSFSSSNTEKKRVNAPRNSRILVSNTSDEVVSCWLAQTNSFTIQPKSKTSLPMQQVNITLYRHSSDNKPICFADFSIVPEHTTILITPRFEIHKELQNGLWS
jgi:hypothetical protein